MLDSTALKAALLGLDDRQITCVATPEWAPTLPEVYVRSLSSHELALLGGLSDPTHELRTAVAMGVVTEEGTSLGFTEAEITLLDRRHAGVMKRLYDAVMVASGLKESAEDLAKNSPGASGPATG